MDRIYKEFKKNTLYGLIQDKSSICSAALNMA